MGCASSKQFGKGYEDPAVLASDTSFSVDEVEALQELYRKMSFSIFNDGLIHKEEFHFALFRSSRKASLFADRVFDLFDLKRNGVVDFGEFLRSLSIFHPKAPASEKAAFAFKLYDLRGTGYIEKEELREMVLALLDESDLSLSDTTVQAIVDNTFSQADSDGDDKIDTKEWNGFVKNKPIGAEEHVASLLAGHNHGVSELCNAFRSQGLKRRTVQKQALRRGFG